MTFSELIEIQQDGGRARALGLPMSDNPYDWRSSCFAAGLDDAHKPNARFAAWKLGWETADDDYGIAAPSDFRCRSKMTGSSSTQRDNQVQLAPLQAKRTSEALLTAF
ncbi:CrpP-related protein [Rhizobium gallicum]|uniref:CrpP-related protein n=1 Tax=Rhizobium gallicum TaxID=56730 RepID=UPI001EF8CCB5|nr:CrpP-related protein [Rhizobium gallicum]ULJ75779.1 hypothetical protein L2W42_24960 [Rhizobium gallicum]